MGFTPHSITRDKKYPHLKEIEIEDTAIGAEWLASGKLNANTAVLCRKATGETNGLELVEKNLEDDKNNRTEFRMFKCSNLNYGNDEKPSLKDSIIYTCINQRGMGYFSKTAVVLGIFIALYIAGTDAFDSVNLATSLGGTVSAIFLFLTSDRARNLVQYRSLRGYWKYYSIPDKGHESRIDLLYETPRIVEIDEIDDELYLKGWICDKAAIPFFEVDKTITRSAGPQTRPLMRLARTDATSALLPFYSTGVTTTLPLSSRRGVTATACWPCVTNR